MFSNSRAEQETVIRWDRLDPTLHVWSADPTVWRKLARLGLTPARSTSRNAHPSGHFYTVPLSHFRWSVRSRSNKPASQATIDRLAAMRAKRRLPPDVTPL